MGLGNLIKKKGGNKSVCWTFHLLLELHSACVKAVDRGQPIRFLTRKAAVRESGCCSYRCSVCERGSIFLPLCKGYCSQRCQGLVHGGEGTVG